VKLVGMYCIAFCWLLAFPPPEATIYPILQIKHAVNVTVNVYGIGYSKYTDGTGRCQV